MDEKQDLNRAQIVNNLAEFREMWESTGDDLTEATASFGLLLADVLVVLGLDDCERAAVLGPCLVEQIEASSRAVA